MTNREINESPERATAGLTSASQLVNHTGAETYAIGNSSSLRPVIGMLIQARRVPSQEPEQVDTRPSFGAALRESLRENRLIIKELAKR